MTEGQDDLFDEAVDEALDEFDRLVEMLNHRVLEFAEEQELAGLQWSLAFQGASNNSPVATRINHATRAPRGRRHGLTLIGTIEWSNSKE